MKRFYFKLFLYTFTFLLTKQDGAASHNIIGFYPY